MKSAPPLRTGPAPRRALAGDHSVSSNAVELELGHAPRADRIFKLCSPRGSIDCVTEVGRQDPVGGGTVIAIFDIGSHRPFVVCRQQRPGTRNGAREVLACSAYFVSEFDR